jgi:hypothetical protein
MARALARSTANCAAAAAAAAASSFPTCPLHPRAGPLGAGVKLDGICPYHGLATLLLLAVCSLLPLVFRAVAALFAA